MVNWWCFTWTSVKPENNVVFYPLPMPKKDLLHFHILAGGNDMAILCYFLLLTRPNPYCSKSIICKVLYGMTTRTKRDFKSKFGYQARNQTWYHLDLKVVSAVMSPVWKSVLTKTAFPTIPSFSPLLLLLMLNVKLGAGLWPNPQGTSVKRQMIVFFNPFHTLLKTYKMYSWMNVKMSRLDAPDDL